MKRSCCVVLVALLVMTLVLPGCSTGQAKSITIVAQDSAESYILTAMVGDLLKQGGYHVDELAGMKGENARNALVDGTIDAYVEYTGVAWLRYLHKVERLQDPATLFDKIRQEDLAANGIEWVDRMNVDSSSALVISKKDTSFYGTSISTLARAQEESHAVAINFRIPSESFDVPDGFHNLEKWYQMTVPIERIEFPNSTTGDIPDYLYLEEISITPCSVAMMSLTEPKIRKFGFVVLKDDKGFFPVCNPAFCIRKGVLAKYPEIPDVLKPLTETLTQQDMITLNYKVEIDGLAPREVAARYLKEKDLIN